MAVYNAGKLNAVGQPLLVIRTQCSASAEKKQYLSIQNVSKYIGNFQ